jgi:RES domain-containing protein
MLVYRIINQEKRIRDLSGTGAYLNGGRWNNEGTYALYTSENSALALLEILVHAGETEMPPHLFIVTIEIADTALIRDVADADLPDHWRLPENLALKSMGDRLLSDPKCLAIRARSAVFPAQYNYIVNPLFSRFADTVRVVDVSPLELDARLRR